jgi:hypothetical protein
MNNFLNFMNNNQTCFSTCNDLSMQNVYLIYFIIADNKIVILCLFMFQVSFAFEKKYFHDENRFEKFW